MSYNNKDKIHKINNQLLITLLIKTINLSIWFFNGKMMKIWKKK